MSGNSDGAGYPLRPLADGLDRDLQRPEVREWLEPRERAALAAPEQEPDVALAAVGRLIRSGDLSRASRTALDDWWRTLAAAPEQSKKLCQRLEKAALAHAAAALGALSSPSPESLPPSWPHDLVAARDAAESALVALGRAALCEAPGAEGAERRIASELRAIDTAAETREAELADAMAAAADLHDAWLSRIARLDGGTWWLDLVVLRDVRKDPRARRAIARPVLRMKRAQIASSLSMSMGSYDAGTLEALLENPLGTSVARLFGGAVEVYAVTFPHTGHESIAGLLLREKSGGAAHIEDVKLTPPGPIAPARSRVDMAWWVPLAGTADSDRDLVVSYRAEGAKSPRQEKLRLELEG